MDDPVVFSGKELESVVFVEQEFLHKTIEKKEDVFNYLTTKLMRERQCETVWMWRLVKAIR